MRKPLCFLINLYQRFISPALPPHCRYSPSCSEYALQAIQKHGARKGLWLGTKRIARCNPFGSHGYDPVPEAGASLPIEISQDAKISQDTAQ